MAQTNIDFWEKILKNPTGKYLDLLTQEKKYIRNHIEKSQSVLDIGCGDGRNLLSLTDITENITGLDIDEKAVSDAKENLKNHPRIKIVLGTGSDLPFPDTVFDRVVLSMTLVNLGDKKLQTLSEMKRVLKPNGQIILSVYSEKSLPYRLEMYKLINLPVKEVSENRVTFDESVGSNTSEQFSVADIKLLVESVGLSVNDHEEVEGIAHLFTLKQEILG
ncbi:MAG: methyltransferase domain-containing protein [Candidatus Pacebacteria bacterium]|nr:methyltransferase domain-containing protein [Candidatus Paceibacterota bacterium]